MKTLLKKLSVLFLLVTIFSSTLVLNSFAYEINDNTNNTSVVELSESQTQNNTAVENNTNNENLQEHDRSDTLFLFAVLILSAGAIAVIAKSDKASE